MSVVGEGIDGLLGYVVRLMVEPGDAVVTSDGAYPTFNYHVAGFGGTLHKVPYRDDHEDPEALFAKAAEVKAKLVYLANPDNPMGSYHTGAEIVAAMDKLPNGTLLVLDEAYIECAPKDAALPLLFDDPRVIRMRTFSKVYGLAGARVGYALAAPDLIAQFEKVRNHFGMNRAAQAGALEALGDGDWLRSVQARIVAARLTGSPRSRKPTVCARCRQPRISSPSIAGATAALPPGCSPKQSPAEFSRGCRWQHRRTAASG